MKLTFIALLAFIYIHTINALTAEQKTLIAKAKTECIVREKVTLEAVDKAFGTPQDYGKVERNLKCYANCFMNKTGVFVKGVIQSAIFEAVLGPSYGVDKIKDYTAKCSVIKGSDDCETAFMVLNCYHKQHIDIM